MPPTSGLQRLGRGLPGYLILFDPHAFVHERQSPSSRLPSPLVFLPISVHFTATPGIPPASPGLQTASFESRLRVEPSVFTPDLTVRLRTLYAQ